MARTYMTYQQAWLYAKMARWSPDGVPPAAPSAHSIRAAVKIASAGSYGVRRRDGSALTAYSAKVAGSNCIGPSAPSRFLPWWTPRAVDRPLSDSIVPIPASTSQVSPGQVPAPPAPAARDHGLWLGIAW